MLDLYKEEGMSPLAPLGGCLMVIIQLMVMIGIIIVVMSPLKYIKGMTSEQIDSKYSQIVEQRVSKLTSEGKSEEDAKKSIALHEKALTLLSQNDDPNFNEFTIRMNIAKLKIVIDSDGALAEFNKINYLGIADIDIARLLHKKGEIK